MCYGAPSGGKNKIMTPVSLQHLTKATREMFRAAVFTVQFTIRIQRLCLERQRAIQPEEEKAMTNMLNVYFEATRSWLAKEIRAPILSILQDPTLTLAIEAPNKGLKKKFNGLFARKQINSTHNILQLKVDANITPRVRVKGIVDAIFKTTEKTSSVPDAILKFLSKLASDGVYFPPEYLSEEEKSGLEFNVLGATRNMSVDDLSHSRFNLVTLAFVLARVAVPNLVLQPWTCGIGGRVRPAKQVEGNLKILATALYVLCMEVVPFLPEKPSYPNPRAVS
ncbi:hypothetical protein ACHHYP_20082 [Achlya hypogyna]|uniref:Uncharacterized protein n=1 Tax=Achlya hypogyna TaxID=1202772 RepID=A0A1V9Z832_ACHHY|nr:hypothetical protein ACHHYP_20082 [Achlya hypogyna]